MDETSNVVAIEDDKLYIRYDEIVLYRTVDGQRLEIWFKWQGKKIVCPQHIAFEPLQAGKTWTLQNLDGRVKVTLSG
jgi:hypothetical protein